YTFCFFRMHHGHGHLNLIWSFWIPLSFVAIERWMRRPTWPRLAVVIVIVVLQALAAWYQAVLITVADAVFLGWPFGVERQAMRASRFALHAAVGALVAIATVWPFARHYFILHTEVPGYAAGRTRGPLRILRMVSIRSARACARAEAVQNSCQIHASLEPRVGDAGSDRLRRLAPSIRPRRACHDGRSDCPSSDRVLRRQVP